MAILKVDPNDGTILWNRSLDFSANGYDEIDGLEIREDGIYTGGWCQELNSSIYQSDIGLWNLNFDGSTDWPNYLGAAKTAERQACHFVVDDDGIYAAGLWGGSGIANLYNGHAVLGKFSKSDGSLMDSVLFGHQTNTFNDIENALGMTSDGQYLYITGYSTPDNVNDWQIFIAKYDKDLNELWYTGWGGSGTESARSIALSEGTIFIGGLSESASLNVQGKHDGLLLMLDTAGNVLGHQLYGDENEEAFQDLAIKGDRIYLTGTKKTGTESQAILVALDDPLVLGNNDLATAVNFTMYPNPTSQGFMIEYDQEGFKPTLLQIRNMQGTKLKSIELSGDRNSISLPKLKTGTYYIQLSNESYSVTKKLSVL
jgi:hypothetical protein